MLLVFVLQQFSICYLPKTLTSPQVKTILTELYNNYYPYILDRERFNKYSEGLEAEYDKYCDTKIEPIEPDYDDPCYKFSWRAVFDYSFLINGTLPDNDYSYASSTIFYEDLTPENYVPQPVFNSYTDPPMTEEQFYAQMRKYKKFLSDYPSAGVMNSYGYYHEIRDDIFINQSIN